MLYNISQVLGIAIIHSLWQGLLIWFLLKAVFMAAPNLAAAKKYNMAVAAMLTVFAWFMVTLFKEAGNFNWLTAKSSPATDFTAVNIPAGSMQLRSQAGIYYSVEAYMPYISILYSIGLLFNLFKLSWCRIKLYQIKKALLPSGELQWKADEFSQRLNISKHVQVSFSRFINVPCMLSYLKPIILLPVSLAAGLSAAEVEAILLHELAHIKRNDYLINLLQQIVTSLLFFNPFAQLIGRLIYTERENCCDDLVVQTTNNPLVYAHALLKLEENRQNNLRLALAASTKKHYLLNRIERIMKTKQTIGNMRHLLVAVLLMAGSLGSIAWLNPEIKNGKIIVKKIKTIAIAQQLFADTGRKKAVKLNATVPKTAAKNRSKTTNVYNWNDGNDFNDQELERLSTKVQKHSDVISQYYDSPEYKKLQEQISRQSEDIQKFYDNPALKKLQDDQEALSNNFEKLNDNPGMRALNSQLEALGKSIEKYYNNPEYNLLEKKYEAESRYSGKYKYGTPEYKKHEAAFDKLSDQFNKYNENPTIREKQKQMRELGKKIQDYYQSPDYIRQRDELTALGKQMHDAYDNPQVKQQQAEMQKLVKQMQARENNPEIKKQQQLMKAAIDKMQAYMNTPEFKKRQKEFARSAGVYKWDNNSKDFKEHPEQPEKPEVPEQPETPEKP